MKKWHVLFLLVYIAEVAFLVFAAVLYIYYFYFGLVICKVDMLIVMIKLTRLIALLLMPLEAILYKVCLIKPKEKAGFSEIPEKEQLHRYAQIVMYIFGAIWLIFSIEFHIVGVGRMGLEQGTDAYIFFYRPGASIILSSGLGLIISACIICGIHANKRA